MFHDPSVPGYDGSVYDVSEDQVELLEEHDIRYDTLGEGNDVVRVRIHEGEPVYVAPMIDGSVEFQIRPVTGGEERWREIDT